MKRNLNVVQSVAIYLAMLALIFISAHAFAHGSKGSKTPPKPEPTPTPISPVVASNLNLDKQLACARAIGGTTTAHEPHGDGNHSAGFGKSNKCAVVNYKYHWNGKACEFKYNEERDYTAACAVAW